MIGKWFVEPLSHGHVRWKAQPWGVEAEFEEYPNALNADPSILPKPVQTQYVRIPWRTLTRMLLTRDS